MPEYDVSKAVDERERDEEDCSLETGNEQRFDELMIRWFDVETIYLHVYLFLFEIMMVAVIIIAIEKMCSMRKESAEMNVDGV